MIFTAYFDESDTHGPTPTLVMAAFLGSARQWELFRRKIKGMQRNYGFKVFHAKEFRALRGEFKGWGPEKCAGLINELAVAIRDGLAEGVTIALPHALYQTEYRGGYVPKGMLLDSQYGVCFRACMVGLLRAVLERGKNHKLHVVIESGHKNVRDCGRIFNEMKAQIDELGGLTLGTITIAKKSECWPLMIADFQAHASHLSETRLKVGLPGYFEMAVKEGGGRPPRGQAALTQMEHSAASLRGLKTAWEADKQARIERRRQARNIKRAAALTGTAGADAAT